MELTQAGWAAHNLANQVVVAHNGEEAQDYLPHRGKFSTRASGNPVVVPLDIKLPKITGQEVLKAIKADAPLKTIPVVMLYSSREAPDLAECHRQASTPT